jgi:glyoxylase-like metal-dependent hydrolase (beta-lactamase superfamily II)
MLSDPMKGISQQGLSFFGGRIEMREPNEVRELTDGAELDLAGLRMTVDHTPGHTRGSVVFHTALEEGGRVMFAGDTLFAGSIGRTDLPGGDMRTMTETLRTKILPLDDDTVVLPGHGNSTTIGRERASNPFLVELDPSAPGPARGL